ncbi:MAG: tRNA (adenosine(37)-N6)-threonylcarbamoyltransferase complex dimerization subunit type 1 TsaB [Alphaproteobacteria bacterium]|nr:tRNA (adenosine(37)-N6)-threonylcarbamoyltransferase complex dimerization subunit type 1 TsaB [Alphaproteobacteria bacterium]
MRILALDGALARCAVALVVDGIVLAMRQEPAGRGQSAALPPMVDAIFGDTGINPRDLDGVAVTVGPGSFTGLRAAIALAHGISAGAGCPVVGVSVAEAMAAALPNLGGRELWVAIDSRRGRVFLHRAGEDPQPIALEDLPRVDGRVAVAGDAAIEVACRLAAVDVDVMLTDVRFPPIRQVALVGMQRLQGDIPPRAAQPLYIDPPEAKLPAGGLRPAPLTE